MCNIAVAPLVGAWIEIYITPIKGDSIFVAPLVGAWIEINIDAIANDVHVMSLLSWERGLKY